MRDPTIPRPVAGFASLLPGICYSAIAINTARLDSDVNTGGNDISNRVRSTGALLLLALLAASPAHAFRCGNKIVIENMHEQQVLNACGEPTAIRHLGYALRNVDLVYRRGVLPGLSGGHGRNFEGYTQEVVVTEYIYNFGPRKFMRRLVFEGGFLVSIETIGYGYHERND